MATMKTVEDLRIVQDALRNIERNHSCTFGYPHRTCQVGVCIKCGEIIYSCQPRWAERQCPCDDIEDYDLGD